MRYGIAVESYDLQLKVTQLLEEMGIEVTALDYDGNQEYYIGGIADYLFDDRMFYKGYICDIGGAERIDLPEDFRKQIRQHLTQEDFVQQIYQMVEDEIQKYIRQFDMSMEVL